jgi:(S)-sulfolactate dehydrogenase
MRVVISEFMDPAAVASLAARFDTACDADLAERRDQLKRLLTDADALIVRNNTQVDAELLAAAPRSTFSSTSRWLPDLRWRDVLICC